MRGTLENIGWLLGCVYSTIPAYWLLVHPFADLWRKRKTSLKHVGWVWPLLWVVAGAVTARWRHQVLYREPWTWIPGVALIATAMYVYSRARRDFSDDQVLGRSELEPDKHEQRLVTEGIRARVRHPYYLAHLLHLSGWALGTGSAAVWMLEAFAIVTGAVMLPLEERELVRRFGDEYREYQRRVPCLFPF
ncbi:MAG TPA: isoprenylcysteine carboxylmethyltransferase family protein [Terriglobales bacterium]|nr:isoprenylcysteine carboxylmethyltransferase family protein [Terriglobales bacterium]